MVWTSGTNSSTVYLHYVFDLWVEAWRKKVAQGDVIVVRYADDLVVGFESRAEAERFLGEFRERLAKFGLELHADKTRLIEFGRFAALNREKRGEGKPETFTFLGFTHYCGKAKAATEAPLSVKVEWPGLAAQKLDARPGWGRSSSSGRTSGAGFCAGN